MTDTNDKRQRTGRPFVRLMLQPGNVYDLPNYGLCEYVSGSGKKPGEPIGFRFYSYKQQESFVIAPGIMEDMIEQL